MPNYKTYIEMSENYESVVDIESEKRNPDMWHDYIIHEDMCDALEKICQSLSYEDMDKRRSFWIHGAYGTGKSYAAIVLKHLFEDPIDKIRPFLSNQRLIKVRDRFIGQRQKGEYLVVWKSQTTDIKSGTQLLMTVEMAVRDKLKERYGDKAYYGKNSVVDAVKEAINDSSINWKNLFNEEAYGLSDDYESFEDFIADVENGNIKACNRVAKIFRDKRWGLFGVIDKFKNWLADIIQGNGLQDTGIIFIWDEFTTYLRDNPNDDVLQPLSEFCKVQPFFMCLIVHKDASWLNNVGEDTYERIVHRYHSMEFHVSDGAAYDLIGSSICVRTGMETQWNSIKNDLMKTIASHFADYDNLDLSNNKKDKIRQLCPLHPMTLSLLTIVAQNFGASQRTIFRFMKDRTESDKNVGFIHYINNYGYDNWRWLTVDFLWDYFFMNESDVKNFSPEAKSAYQHFVSKKDYIADEYRMHVFKAAMLLIAVVSSGNVSNLYSQITQRKVSSTRNTLYKCFNGMLEKEDVDSYLNDLVEIGVLRLDSMQNGDARLLIPYSGIGSGDVFEHRKQTIKNKNTRYELFKKGGLFAKEIEAKFLDKNEAVSGRLYVAAACSDTSSINNRRDEILAEITKNQYKFGILVITIDTENKFTELQDKVRQLATQDTTGRFAVCLLRTPLTEDDLDRWYSQTAHSELAGEEGKPGDSERYKEEADIIISTWVASASDGQIMAMCGNKTYPGEWGVSDILAKLKKDIIFGSVFTAAPERVVMTNTAYKKIQQTTVEAGIRKEKPNTQIGAIVDGLKTAAVWDIPTLSEISLLSGSPAKDAISAIAKLISQRFSQGTQIKVDELWQELQRPPFGYYNCMACGYILGFILRFYVNSEFSWNKGDNNPWPFTEKNIATMISEMCAGKTVNHYLSPGSEVWQKFKEYVKKIFKLEDGQVVNEIEARKYISKQCTENAGVPFWVLKYVSEEKFGGAAAKEDAVEIISQLCEFIMESSTQESVMCDILQKFTGKGSLRKTLTELFFDKKTAYDAFVEFIYSQQADIKALQQEIGLTNHDMFDSIHQLMQGQVSTWTEQEVGEKLETLSIEYRAVAELNKALNTNKKNIKQVSDEIKNAFDNMKIPGSIIEMMRYSWIPTLKAMHSISTTQWIKIEKIEQLAYIDLIAKDGATAWGNAVSPRSVLQEYMSIKGFNCTETELDEILNALKPARYDLPKADFENRIKEQLNKIAYNRDKVRINELWKLQSGFDTVTAWCNKWTVPIQWVASDEELEAIEILYSIQSGRIVNNLALHNATRFFENNTITALKDKTKINDAFFAQIGENYRVAFESNITILISRLKTNRMLTSDVYSWAHKIKYIKECIDEFLRVKYCEEAKQKVKDMDANRLKEKVIELLEKNPDLYSIFIK